MSPTAVSVAAAGLPAAAQPTMMSLAGDELIRRFLASDEAWPIACLAMRRLQARNERFHTDGWRGTCTELTPESVFRCRVNALENERDERIAGVRVPATLESVAQVRMVGRSSRHVSCHYPSDDGRALNGERDVRATADAGTPSSLAPAPAPGERHGSHAD